MPAAVGIATRIRDRSACRILQQRLRGLAVDLEIAGLAERETCKKGNMISQGSGWHRWEPHIHSPGTVTNNQFMEPTALERLAP